MAVTPAPRENRFEFQGALVGLLALLLVFVPVIPRGETPIAEEIPPTEGMHTPSSEPAPAPDLDGPEAPSAALSGLVRLPGGAPASGARVRVFGSALLGFLEVGADDEGRFAFPALPPGFYELHAFRGAHVAHAARGIQVKAGESTEITLDLVPGVSIRGRVVSARTGEGLRGAEVRVSGELLDVAARVVETTADGTFVIDGLTPGEKILRVHKEGFVHDGPLQVMPGGDEFLIRLGTEARLRIEVVDPRGRPVTDAEAQLLVEGSIDRAATPIPAPRDRLLVVPGPVPPIPAAAGAVPDARKSILASASSDERGLVEMDGLAAATVRVRLSADGRPTVIGEPIELRPGQTREARMTLPYGGRLSVRVFDSVGVRAEDADLAVHLEGDPIGAYARTDENGEAEFSGLLGALTVRASRGATPPVVQRVSVGEGEHHTLTLTLTEARDALFGRVVDARGFGIAGATLELTTLSKRSPFEAARRSEPDGTFRFEDLPAPPYRVVVRHPAYAESEPIRVDARGEPLNVTLDPGGAIVFELRDRRTLGPVPAEVTLVRGDRHIVRRAWPDGRVEIDHVPLGRWTLRVDDPRYVPFEQPVELARDGARPPRVDLGRIDLFQGATVSGELVDSLGEPIYGARIVAGDGAHAEVKTDEGGRFTVTRLAPGRLRVAALLDSGERVESAVFSLREGEVREGLRLVARSRGEAVDVAPASPSARVGIAATVVDRDGGVVVDWVAPGSKAQKKGLRPGDRVLAVDGASVLIAAQVRPLLRASAGERRTLRIARGARTLELVIEPEPFTPP